VLVWFVGSVPQIIIYFKKEYIFHVEDESPWVDPGPQGFCRAFGPVGFFVWGFFSMWAFLALAHMGQGQTLWTGPN